MGISISARFIFMYLLYTKRSVNSLSLTFCLMNIASSSMWMKYSFTTGDMPLLVRSSADIVLFFISAAYIANNKLKSYNDIFTDQVGMGREAPHVLLNSNNENGIA